jgi:hypothetical protein
MRGRGNVMQLRLPVFLLTTALALSPPSFAQQDNGQACLKLAYQVAYFAKPLAETAASKYASSFDRGSSAGKVCGVYSRAIPKLREMGCYADVMDVMNQELGIAKTLLAEVNSAFRSAHPCYATDMDWAGVVTTSVSPERN